MNEIVQHQIEAPLFHGPPPSTLGLVPEPATPPRKRKRARAAPSRAQLAKEIERRVMARLEARLRPVVGRLVERLLPIVRAQLIDELEARARR
jgi:hypothetical protein